MLCKTEPDYSLLLYVAVSDSTVSSVLIKEEGSKQHLVYYVSKALARVEKNYPKIEKVTFTVATMARKLRLYFQAHAVTVLTDQPLKYALQQPSTSGRLIKWAVELGEFDIEYKPRGVVKGQAVADFVAELTPSIEVEKLEGTTLAKDNGWLLNIDGSSTNKASGGGIVMISPVGEELEYAIRFGFKATSNEVEYKALVNGLKIAHKLRTRKVKVRSDSKLIVDQIHREYEVKGERMEEYLQVM